jgi:hypothetical protein
MMKSRLIGTVCAVLFTFVCVPINAEDGVAHNTGKYDSQDTFVHSIAAGANQVKHNGNNSLTSGLQHAVIVISCGLIGVFLLRMTNKS